jgi:ribonuclease P protein component
MAPPSRTGSGQHLTREERLRRRAQFQRVYDHGSRTHGRFLTLFVLANDLATSRLGVAATRKLGGAVRRNWAKRRVRELFRRHKIAPGYDIIVIPRPQLLDADFAALESDYRATLRRRFGR